MKHRDEGIAPELAALGLPDKPDGPGAAAMIAAGVGVFTLGLLTTLAEFWTGLSGFLADFQGSRGVGGLAGKSTLAIVAWLVCWGVLALLWRGKDFDLKLAFRIGLVLGALGALLTFPPFFTLFA
ncbi:MAG: hypothetical protein A2Z12_09890 [Actinobacteria bacterium RBG_16_68_21]|nr:MAG: hypothetical protein A2Z12_09890 [Actinobacteria bacterium RBG_16_68_21]